MKAVFFAFTGAVVGLLLLGCGLTRDRESAIEQACHFYEALQAGNLDSAVVYLGPEFFELTPEADFRLLIPEIERREGSIESFRLTGWHVNKNHNAEIGNGTYVTLQFAVVHGRHQATETLLLYRSKADRAFKIIGYTLDSEETLRAKL